MFGKARDQQNQNTSDLAGDDLVVFAQLFPVEVAKRARLGKVGRRVPIRARVDGDGRLEFYVAASQVKYLH